MEEEEIGGGARLRSGRLISPTTLLQHLPKNFSSNFLPSSSNFPSFRFDFSLGFSGTNIFTANTFPQPPLVLTAIIDFEVKVWLWKTHLALYTLPLNTCPQYLFAKPTSSLHLSSATTTTSTFTSTYIPTFLSSSISTPVRFR